MTKLTEWLTVLTVLISIWWALYMEMILPQWGRNHPMTVLSLPVVGVALFGLYSVGVIAYRVATFNDCEEAAQELQSQIVEAQADLKKKGFKAK
ncbi:hypothetical protein TCAL_11718 [Tigriopus californicus]|uniref:Dolichol-phosphate mannosyltransferase subunit 3 n=1 Tax=Tigriopus californicus TaxID=6832 RepID=A0A553ND55_TIGCA|nr:dolichol-phosphate mannosyltransferase subunit 3-like [Tigriopus californicus]TRY63381.1 hypothetical protein TCAL_11718 [Tigriopus californicus]|eukprot:TCALIF_11718-PA protein Name:"Similar to Dpm3 Dolichol-phosphate mannosyltransferase subunit 3 (Mus musculus)" AED:0.29 eAED:0.30 QI:0/-1/0/1/-1/1/1/0/93